MSDVSPLEGDATDRSATASLQAVVDAAMEAAFAISTRTMRILAVNSRFVEASGIPSDELVGEPCASLCSGPGASCPGRRCPLPLATTGQDSPISLHAGLLAGDDWSVAGRVRHAEGVAILLRPPWSTRPVGNAHRGESRASEGAPTVRALGGFSVRLASGEEFAPRRPQTLRLLQLLLVSDGAVSNAHTAASLWPERQPLDSINSIRVLVHDLRHSLEPGLARGRRSRYIANRGDGYELIEGSLDSDVDSFLRDADAARVAFERDAASDAIGLAERALDVYGGDLFGVEPEAPWFAQRREDLRRQSVDLRLLYAMLLTGAGNRHSAIEHCRRVTAVDPWREDAHRLMMLLLAERDGRATAGKYFLRMFSESKREYGVPPSKETAEFVDRLTRGDPFEPLRASLLHA